MIRWRFCGAVTADSIVAGNPQGSFVSTTATDVIRGGTFRQTTPERAIQNAGMMKHPTSPAMSHGRSQLV